MAYIDTARAGSPIANVIEHLREEVQKYLRYRETYAALKAAPLDVMIDLDLDAGNLRSVARRAVYNR